MKQFPQYTLAVSEVSVSASDGEGPVEVELSVECGLIVESGPQPKKKKNARGMDMTVVLTYNSDLDFIDFRRIPYVLSIIALVRYRAYLDAGPNYSSRRKLSALLQF